MDRRRFRNLKSVGLNSEQSETEDFDLLKSKFETVLRNVRSEKEVSDLISDINNCLKNNDNLTSDNRSDLKGVRQKAYDRKKRFPTSEEIQTPIASKNIPTGSDQNPKLSVSPSKEFNTQINFLGYLCGNKIILVRLFKVCIFLIFAVLSMLFIYQQSVPIYSTIGFSEPQFCALGSILLIIGFSLIYSLTGSKILLILCIYASTYEILLIVRGTFRNDLALAQEKVSSNENVQWLEEKAKHSKEIYDEVNQKLEDPTSKVFQNPWFRKKFVDTAWNAYSQDEAKIESTKKSLNNSLGNTNSITILKIMFRLGIVLLGMVSIHFVFQTFSKNIQQ